MRRQIIYFVFLFLLATIGGAGFAVAQAREPRGGGRPAAPAPNRPRANQGHIPPAPPKRSELAAPREPERMASGHVNETPHVNNNHWYGHESVNDARFRQDRPFEQGRFARFGPQYRYRFQRVDRDRHLFWLPGGFYFHIADWDWPLFADWCWDCGDDFVVYEDADHPGWYLIYNVHTGVYVHATYMGT
jgi:hypothetical protein